MTLVLNHYLTGFCRWYLMGNNQIYNSPSKIMRIPHHQWLIDNLRTRYREPWMKTYECVWAVKKYMLEVLRQPYRFFWLTAKKGWENTQNTFPPELWDRIEYTPWINPPTRGSVIFYNFPEDTYHVSIVHNANKLFIVKIEQNYATWNWHGLWYDAINMNVSDFKNVIGWYTLKKL